MGDGKSNATGADALAQPISGEFADWKLTLKDDERNSFEVDSVTTDDGKTLTVKYSRAKKGDNEYISAIIKAENGNVKYYGKLALASDDDEATTTVNIDGKMSEGDSLYIFNEQCNGDYETDYSSSLQEIAIPHVHDWSTEWSTDDDKHWHECTTCPEHADEAAHAEEIDAAVTATCTETGLTEGKHCSVCNKILQEQNTISATGHAFGDWIDTTPNTCEDAGVHQHICTVCGFTESEATNPKGHDVEYQFTIDVPATCTTDGSQSKHCTRCDAVFESEVIPATGHSFSAWKTTKAATEIAAGQQTRKCSACGETETKAIAQLKPTLPAVKIGKPKAAKKSATIKWTKVSKKNQKKIATIQIQYSTDKTFKTGVKTVTAKKTAASKKITKLTSKKTYYVRIRAYKKSGGVAHVSKWSTVKPVKIK